MVDKGDISPKKVVLIVIDSLRPTALQKCLADGTVPALEYLCRQGQVSFECISVFPTMTPTATASIVTGGYPDAHQIPGFVWYHRDEKRIVNYGATAMAIWKIGLKTVLNDLLCNLNGQHLSRNVQTVHEIMEDFGLTSANINFFTFRGHRVFKARLPWWARIWVGSSVGTEVWGPPLSVVGQIVPPPFACRGRLKTPQGILHKFGVNDEFAGTVAYHLIRQGKQPHLTIVYLPDTDSYTHRHHTDDLSPAIMRADQQVEKILNAFGSWQEAVAENVFVVLGDHSQSLVRRDPDSIINLPVILDRFKQLKLGATDMGDCDLAVCPNERMSHLYMLRDRAGLREQLTDMLAADPRIDQIMWREAAAGKALYRIRKGGSPDELVFGRDGPLTDPYGCTWWAKGDLRIIDATERIGQISYATYPDAFNVMAALMESRHCGDITMTARLGYEFGGEAAPVHPGRGSHGSFHREDAAVPLIITGSHELPENPRVVDIVPLILKNFGI